MESCVGPLVSTFASLLCFPGGLEKDLLKTSLSCEYALLAQLREVRDDLAKLTKATEGIAAATTLPKVTGHSSTPRGVAKSAGTAPLGAEVTADRGGDPDQAIREALADDFTE